jgi:hypothetical protein
VLNLARQYQEDGAHSRHVADLAAQLLGSLEHGAPRVRGIDPA